MQRGTAREKFGMSKGVRHGKIQKENIAGSGWFGSVF